MQLTSAWQWVATSNEFYGHGSPQNYYRFKIVLYARWSQTGSSHKVDLRTYMVTLTNACFALTDSGDVESYASAAGVKAFSKTTGPDSSTWGVSVEGDGTIYTNGILLGEGSVYIDGSDGGTKDVELTGYWKKVSYTSSGSYAGIPYHSTVAQCSATVTLPSLTLGSKIQSITDPVYTLSSLMLTVERAKDSYWHKAVFKSGSKTLYSSAAFSNSLSLTVPRSWFSTFQSAASLTVSVTLQTYTDSACTSPIGDAAVKNITVYADDGMKPTVSEGFAAVSVYNEGSVSDFSVFVQGYSRAKITFDSSKVDLSDDVGATISGYKITAAGQTVSDSPFLTPVLTGKTDIVCTVMDSRGRSASVTLTVTPKIYSLPAVNQISVFRCISSGEKSEDGTYLSAKAAAVFSSLGGENSVSMSVQYRVPGGSWSAAAAMASGIAAVTGGTMSPDQNYEVKINISDALNSGEATLKLPGRKWAIKFREKGDGVGFGMAPQADKVLQIPAAWMFMVGEKTLLDIIYPVGSVYISSQPTDPGTLFGGTWTRIKDTFILAAGDSYAIGATGGAKTVTLTENQIPAHAHTFKDGSYTFLWGIKSGLTNPVIAVGANASAQYATSNELITDQNAWSGTNNTGGSKSHNNMPPYITRYVWERTA